MKRIGLVILLLVLLVGCLPVAEASGTTIKTDENVMQTVCGTPILPQGLGKWDSYNLVSVWLGGENTGTGHGAIVADFELEINEPILILWVDIRLSGSQYTPTTYSRFASSAAIVIRTANTEDNDTELCYTWAGISEHPNTVASNKKVTEHNDLENIFIPLGAGDKLRFRMELDNSHPDWGMSAAAQFTVAYVK